MNYEIQNNVPIPAKTDHGSKTDTLQSISVGQSFECPKGEIHSFRSIWARLGPKKFSSKKQGNGNVRIWRTA